MSIQFLYPIFLVLLAWPCLGEKPSGVDAAATVLALVGTVLVVRPPFLFRGQAALPKDAARERNLGIVLATLGAVFASVVYLTIRRIGKRATPMVLATW